MVALRATRILSTKLISDGGGYGSLQDKTRDLLQLAPRSRVIGLAEGSSRVYLTSRFSGAEREANQGERARGEGGKLLCTRL